jgi:ubiquinone/menaquinone biosynthesis C-methylase UbiE
MKADLLDRQPGTEVPGGFRPDASNKGINWPRLYDALVSILTRGEEDVYRREILTFGQVAAGHHVLDIGCGTGTQALTTHRMVQPEGSVVGVDISAKMIARARYKAAAAGLDIRFQQADAAHLPFAEGQFDVVFFTTVMHMIPAAKHARCLLEARRVIRPGGRLLIIDYAGAPDKRRHWSAKHGRHGRFDLHQLRGALADLGFIEPRETPLRLSLHALSTVRP